MLWGWCFVKGMGKRRHEKRMKRSFGIGSGVECLGSILGLVHRRREAVGGGAREGWLGVG